ncbi:MAG TPA: hypothetical protein VFG76_06865 [Candidatus Polarisedimenticolia bacterium]|nr:hypothetical protein [Candidatus Polarisedimenticolia bacterium]
MDVSAYVAAGAAGTFTNIGYTKGPLTIEEGGSDYEVKAEQVLGALASVPVDKKITLKFTFLQAELDDLQKVLRQPAANLTGTPPNKSLLIGDPVETYHQIKVTGKAIGGSAGIKGVRTITMWRVAFVTVEPIGMAKDSETVWGVTMTLVYDETVATADKYYKIIDTGGS